MWIKLLYAKLLQGDLIKFDESQYKCLVPQ